MNLVLLITLLLVSLGSVFASTNDVTLIENPDNGLKSWSWQGDGLAIELVQVAPDFIRASYSSRGLPSSLTESVATRCVFGTIIRNISNKALKYRVADWRYNLSGQSQEKKIKTKTEWLKEWHAMGVRFSWSILADDPVFEVGDWVQGFTTMAEPHGSIVDIMVRWEMEGQHYEKILSGLECADANAGQS